MVKSISWKVNNGSRVSFWRDYLNGQIPLSNSSISPNIIEVSEFHQGTQLNQFVANVCKFSGTMSWKNPDVLPLSSQEINQFIDILASRQVFFSRSEDKIFWAPAKDGQ